MGFTVEQQPVGKLVQQSSGEVERVKLTKPIQTQNQPVIEQGNLRIQNMFLLMKGKTSRSHEIDEKRLHEELGSSDRSGKPEKLSEDIRV